VKKILTFAAVLLLMVGSLTGCSGQEETDSASPHSQPLKIGVLFGKPI